MNTVYSLKPVYAAENLFSGCAAIFVAYAEEAFGLRWTVGDGGLILTTDKSLPAEGYKIETFEDRVIIAASAAKGMHNGLASLLSIIQPEAETLTIPAMSVIESPDCSYRGLMIDLARQWHPLPYILQYIDLCWKNHASHLQLHFTDMQSYTLPCSAYPGLSTEGRSYTKEDIHTIVEYAKAREIILVPEVEVPGHTTQFFLKYPEIFGNTGVLPACEEVFDALRNIFTEVADMFPHSPMIHLGGDEAAIGCWEKCDRTQAYMQANSIESIHEMYAEYIRIVTDMILALDRTPVVWEGFAKEYNDRIDRRTIVIVWESYYQLATDLAEAGFTLINCSWKPLYVCTGREERCWSPEEIAALDPWIWDHWMQKSPACGGMRIDRKYPVLGEQICAWGDYIAGWENWEDGIRLEMQLVSARLPAMCGKLWNLE